MRLLEGELMWKIALAASNFSAVTAVMENTASRFTEGVLFFCGSSRSTLSNELSAYSDVVVFVVLLHPFFYSFSQAALMQGNMFSACCAIAHLVGQCEPYWGRDE
ncbi:hypothetical protein TcCL_Unassigned00178 [Trypanosoma cruzi]|nr:hypothetical protein TcCL_Unassigned00178 [Trypanosoma cruzi]